MHFGAVQHLAGLKDLKMLSTLVDASSELLDVMSENFKKLEKLLVHGCRTLDRVDGLKFRLLNGVGSTDLTFEYGVGSAALEVLYSDEFSLERRWPQ